MAMHQSRQQGLKVGIVSCEDPEWVWGSRIISALQGVNTEKFFGKEPDPYTVGKALLAVKEAREYGMHFSFQIGRKVEAVLAAVKELVLGKGCSVVMVDYLQAIAAPGANRYEARTDHAQALKGFCHDRGVPLVLASQLKRPEGGAVGKEPSSNDLKDSGDVENMSEAVILLWPVSDEENAQTLGKVSKVKWSPKRTKFALHRNTESGALVSLIEPPEQPQDSGPPNDGFKRRQQPDRRRGGWNGYDE
jgi:replicative DNA helicase